MPRDRRLRRVLRVPAYVLAADKGGEVGSSGREKAIEGGQGPLSSRQVNACTRTPVVSMTEELFSVVLQQKRSKKTDGKTPKKNRRRHPLYNLEVLKAEAVTNVTVLYGNGPHCHWDWVLKTGAGLQQDTMAGNRTAK